MVDLVSRSKNPLHHNSVDKFARHPSLPGYTLRLSFVCLVWPVQIDMKPASASKCERQADGLAPSGDMYGKFEFGNRNGDLFGYIPIAKRVGLKR